MMSSQDSNRMYSWLWDSHISPKNSKWLQENLSEIDSTVKQIIKIIEEDGDSFARRAEMYYKRRPELMRLVEQFYRTYRGLAERYSHATGVIRQAHHTMAEAFPDQVPPLLLTEECHTGTTRVVNNAECCGWDEEMNALKRSDLFGFDEKDATLGTGKRLGKLVECGDEVKADAHMKGCDGNLEGEKEGGFVGLQRILERLAALESRVSCAEEESRRLKEKASRAASEAYLLNEAVRRSEAEKEAVVVQYKQCVERISSLESELSRDPSSDTETQVPTLKSKLESAEAEKDTILAQHSRCATMISSLQKKLINAEEEAKMICERADKAEDEVEWLKKEILKLEEEKEVVSLVYWQSIEKISSLENDFSSTKNEVFKLNGEINSATFKLQAAEERYLSLERSKDRLQSEMQLLVQEMECQRQQLLEKQTEFGRVWTRVQDELRFVTLQLSSKEDLLKECELRNTSLEDKTVRMNEAMEHLNEQNLSSELAKEYFKSVNDELRAKIVKLDEEVEVNVNQRNVLKHEKNVLLEKLRSMEKVLEENTMLQKSLFDLNCVLDNSDADRENGYLYASEETHLKLLLRKVDNLKQKLRQTLDNNELLGLERSVLVMLFGQLRTETAEAEKERNALQENLNSESWKLTTMQNEAENLLKMIDGLGQKINEKSDRVEKLENDIQGLNSKLSEIQDSYQNLEMQNSKLLEENSSFKMDLLELKQRNRALEDENWMVLIEALSLGNISLVFENFVTEKTIEVEELAYAVSEAKDLLHEKGSQLGRVEHKLVDTQKEKALLEDNAEAMKKDFSKARETQDAKILKLSSDNSREIANNTFLHKMVKQLDAELVTLLEQCEETKARERALSSELENKRNEIKELLSKVLISSVEEAVFIEKANELTGKCQILEEQRILESGDLQVLREKVSGLEGENIVLKVQINALIAAVDSLSDSFLSLESYTGKNLDTAETPKEGLLDYNMHGEGTGDLDHNAALFRGLAKVRDLQIMIKGLEKLIADMRTLRTPEDLSTDIKREVPRDVGLRSQRGCDDLDSRHYDVGVKKVLADTQFVDSDTPKDMTPYKACKFENQGSSRTDERMLEPWEIGSEGQSIDLTVSKGQKAANSISGIMIVDEGLEVVDKLEVSKRFIDSYHEENKRKMLEKLESDGLKLANLQITVQDLLTKVSITEKTKKKDHDIEYNTVKEQLEEAEEVITKLSEMNTKLKKAVQENDHVSLNGKSQSEFEHAWNLRRRKILDHANRGAERLTRLQLEVQKLQFLLVKLDNEQEKKPKTRITDSGPKFLLKDYLQGRARSVRLSGINQSKKKIFCGCIQPPTNEDSPRYRKN